MELLSTLLTPLHFAASVSFPNAVQCNGVDKATMECYNDKNIFKSSHNTQLTKHQCDGFLGSLIIPTCDESDETIFRFVDLDFWEWSGVAVDLINTFALSCVCLFYKCSPVQRC